MKGPICILRLRLVLKYNDKLLKSLSCFKQSSVTIKTYGAKGCVEETSFEKKTLLKCALERTIHGLLCHSHDKWRVQRNSFAQFDGFLDQHIGREHLKIKLYELGGLVVRMKLFTMGKGYRLTTPHQPPNYNAKILN